MRSMAAMQPWLYDAQVVPLRYQREAICRDGYQFGGIINIPAM